MASGDPKKPLVTYEEVKQAGSDPNAEILIVDVREPAELAESGIIPASINIPLGTLEDIMKNISDEEFQSKFGRNKPTELSPIIVSCRSGKRSDQAQDILQKLGWKNVKNYSGGWCNWAENNGS